MGTASIPFNGNGICWDWNGNNVVEWERLGM